MRMRRGRESTGLTGTHRTPVAGGELRSEAIRQLRPLLPWAFALVMLMLILVGGGLASLWWGGGWVWPSGSVIATLMHLVRDPSAPARAYAGPSERSVPDAPHFWATVAALEVVYLMVSTWVVISWLVRREEAGGGRRGA